jgi:fructose-1,6-bisphosphatase
MDNSIIHIVISVITVLVAVAAHLRNKRNDEQKSMEELKLVVESVRKHCHDVNARLATKVITSDKDIGILRADLNNEIKNTGKQLDKIIDKLDEMK